MEKAGGLVPRVTRRVSSSSSSSCSFSVSSSSVHSSLLLLLFLLLAFPACRTPQTVLPKVSAEAVAQEAQAMQTRFLEDDDARRERLHRVTFPILREAAGIFKDKPRPAIGVVLLTDDSYPELYRARARERWAIGEAPIIRHVAPGSPADRAGLRSGDQLTHIAGTPISAHQGDFLKKLSEAMEPGQALAITVTRGLETIETTVTPAAIADTRIRLRYDAAINARATGRTIEVNRALIDFCRNDTELAFIVAHELAHNALRHHRDFVINYLLGTAADVALLFVGIPTPNALGVINTLLPSADFESEADMVALLLLDRAGYDLTEVLDFWPRLSTLAPTEQRGWFFIGTHPDFPLRQARLRAAIEQLQARLDR